MNLVCFCCTIYTLLLYYCFNMQAPGKQEYSLDGSIISYNKPALPEQEQYLLEQLQRINSNVIDVEIATLYFLVLKGNGYREPNNADDFINNEKTCKLLSINGTRNNLSKQWQSSRDKLLYVVPRQGTISAWSSKATDIFKICNVDFVDRVEHGVCYRLQLDKALNAQDFICSDAIKEQLHDRMVETIYSTGEEIEAWLATMQPHNGSAVGRSVNESNVSQAALNDEAQILSERILNFIRKHGKGSALSEEELSRFAKYYIQAERMPTNTELTMYAQVNSEHCRHKLFNAHWLLDSELQEQTLFEMIKSTRDSSINNVVSAYEDNAAIVRHDSKENHLKIDCRNRHYVYEEEDHFYSIKVETHNHPTAISPFPGAATGSGGEIRDESATGRGGSPRMGLVGFSLSNLHIPDFEQPWEDSPKYPERIASALQIITEGPLGAARFNNEFGRPCVCGYFRTYEQQAKDYWWGYHKPIMVAGGLGSIRKVHIKKEKFAPGTPLIVFGGPAMRIGLGGGSASSVSNGNSSHELDFASVQRDNAEMQRRCQEVIAQCVEHFINPILSIHDIGAGGLANALPELVHGSGLGAQIDLRTIPCSDDTLLPMEIWCNESQERYVAAIDGNFLDAFRQFCERERCPMAVIGKATSQKTLVLKDSCYSEGTLQHMPINMPMEVLFEKLPDDTRPLKTMARDAINPCKWQDIDLNDAIERVLKMPAVASKSFLITIGDRSVTGLICRDQMVGPWQVPVSDVAVSSFDYIRCGGEAMAMGERTPVATHNAAASGRLAVAEAILNILAADISALHHICLSANWMAASALAEQRFDLYKTVQAVTDLCKKLNIAIPMGKDSLSMQTCWNDAGQDYEVNSPLSLIVSAFAQVEQVKATLTPQLNMQSSEKRIFLIDVSGGDNRLGCSCLMQAYKQEGEPPDFDDPKRLIDFFEFMRELREGSSDYKDNRILAYHDRSDGGLLVSLIEMAFAANCGVCCKLNEQDELLPALFSEAPGVLLQLSEDGVKQMYKLIARYKDTLSVREIGHIREDLNFEVRHKGQMWTWDLMQLKRWWSETGSRIQALRDDPHCAEEEMETLCDAKNPGLSAEWDFELPDHIGHNPTSVLDAHSFSIKSKKPKVAIIREQGVNGHMEMAAAFERAGFAAYDIHMNDLIKGEADLKYFQGLAACGGFSYGDVLGAGAGWAHSILMHDRTREAFEVFFNRLDTFTLGVCNGCQMLSRIKEIIPGTSHWPTFEGNRSKQFESRLVKVEITPSPSVLLEKMTGARLPIVVAHGEGKVTFTGKQVQEDAIPYACLRYIDNYNCTTDHYPENPNGSPHGMTAFCSTDGRATIMMPHPERLFRSAQYSWRDPEWGDAAPWFKLFHNAYSFCL